MYLIVGAGISGSVLANLIAERLNQKVLIIDRREHIAGNCFDYLNANENITVHKYGPHIFHTNNKEVWDYLSNFTKWHYFYLKPNVMIEGNRVSLPFTLKTLRELFSTSMAERIENKLITKYGYGVKVPILDFQKSKDKDLNFIGKFVYENVFKNYTIKQWGLKPEEIDASVTARVPIYISNDSRYFQDKYQAIPIKGYTKLIENILNHKNITVQLNTDYKTLSQNEMKEFIGAGGNGKFTMKMMNIPYSENCMKNEDGTNTKINFVSGDDIMFVPSKATNKSLAKEFLAYLCNEEQLLAFTKSTGCMRPFNYDPIALTAGKDGYDWTEFQKSCFKMYTESDVNLYLYPGNHTDYKDYSRIFTYKRPTIFAGVGSETAGRKMLALTGKEIMQTGAEGFESVFDAVSKEFPTWKAALGLE